MSNLSGIQWEEKLLGEGLSALEVWSLVNDLKLADLRVKELEEANKQLEKSSIWDKLPKMPRPDVPQEVQE